MITPQNLDKWMFNYYEGNLSGEELEAFEKFLLNNPEYEVNADAWEQAFVAPLDVEYPHIASLEKKRKVAGIWYGWAAAASLAVIVGGSAMYLSGENTFATNQKLNANKVVVPFAGNEVQLTSPSLDIIEFETLSNNNTGNNSNHLTASNQQSIFNTTSGDLNQENLNATSNQAFGTNQSQNQVNNSANEMIADNDGTILNTNEFVSNTSNLALEEAKTKLIDEEGKGEYINNPDYNPLAYDVKYKKTVTYNSFSSKMKNAYRRIERTMGYPVGLKNLRDPELILPQNSLLGVNPGFTGGMLASRFDMNYRNQFFGNDINTQELNLSFDSYIREMSGGVGVLVNMKDYGFGDFTDFNVSLFYSPKFRISDDIVFEPAVKLTLGSLSANTDNLLSYQDLELERGMVLNTGDLTGKSGFQRNWYKDYGLGGVLNTKWFYLGFSADNLGGHYRNVFADESGTPGATPVKYSAVAGADYENQKKTMTLSPFLTYTNFGDFNELWGGLNYKLNFFSIGAGVSNNLDYTGSIGLKFEKFKLVYRYDNARSMITNDKISSHSIGIRFNTKQKSSRIK